MNCLVEEMIDELRSAFLTRYILRWEYIHVNVLKANWRIPMAPTLNTWVKHHELMYMVYHHTSQVILRNSRNLVAEKYSRCCRILIVQPPVMFKKVNDGPGF